VKCNLNYFFICGKNQSVRSCALALKRNYEPNSEKKTCQVAGFDDIDSNELVSNPLNLTHYPTTKMD
jgi:hypothetical protein